VRRDRRGCWFLGADACDVEGLREVSRCLSMAKVLGCGSLGAVGVIFACLPCIDLNLLLIAVPSPTLKPYLLSGRNIFDSPPPLQQCNMDVTISNVIEPPQGSNPAVTAGFSFEAA